ncbi:hypothetical protein I553_9224 [Mycobacterium xenopi 4042]|uniref:Uncharacterized protein n=1 Tax=Mycobacterium xenopi 4042 TaxID=1299334 RepID=X8A9N5_MYCXE|nr:hypothetical protein I553_9224 [Mycobacterium xenopi 4042]
MAFCAVIAEPMASKSPAAAASISGCVVTKDICISPLFSVIAR